MNSIAEIFKKSEMKKYGENRLLTVVEDYPDASSVFRSQGTDICGSFPLYGPWNDGLGDR